MMNLNLNAVLYLGSSDIARPSFLYKKRGPGDEAMKEIKPTREYKRENKSESSCHLVITMRMRMRNDVINRLGHTPLYISVLLHP